jgi:hypothetical protein
MLSGGTSKAMPISTGNAKETDAVISPEALNTLVSCGVKPVM